MDMWVQTSLHDTYFISLELILDSEWANHMEALVLGSGSVSHNDHTNLHS